MSLDPREWASERHHLPFAVAMFDPETYFGLHQLLDECRDACNRGYLQMVLRTGQRIRCEYLKQAEVGLGRNIG